MQAGKRGGNPLNRRMFVCALALAGTAPAQERKQPVEKLAPYLPTPPLVVERMLQFAAGKPVRKAKEAALAPRAVLAGPEKTFEEAEQAYIGKEYSRAQELYRKVLEESTDKLLQTKAYYGLARIAIFQKDPALAEKLFQKALDSSPDPQTAAWAHIYLARLADLEGERDQAVQHYRAVAGIAGAPESARQIAEKGLREAFQKK